MPAAKQSSAETRKALMLGARFRLEMRIYYYVYLYFLSLFC